MIAWLVGLYNRVYNKPIDLWNAVISTFITVYGFLASVNDVTIRSINAIYVGLWRLGLAWGSFATGTWPQFTQYVNNMFALLWRRIDKDRQDLINLVNDSQHQTNTTLTVIDQNLSNGLAGLLAWVIKNVLLPLTADIGRALAWIGKEGAYVFDLLTHLDKLVELLLAFLWSAWLGLVRKYAKQVILLILASWKTWIAELLPIIEDIIAAII